MKLPKLFLTMVRKDSLRFLYHFNLKSVTVISDVVFKILLPPVTFYQDKYNVKLISLELGNDVITSYEFPK